MSRNEQIKSERRRRNADSLQGKRRRLSVDESKLDRQNFEYRFANDVETRIHDLTVKDDWEVVTDRSQETKGNTSDLGAGVSTVAGTGEGGSPVNAILLRKPKAYYDADVARSQSRIDEKEKSLASGNAPRSDDGASYVPDSGINLNGAV